ncbi:hypothetical protein ACQKM9_13285 [Viridibacillus sp. NPDC093762]
MEKGEEHKPSKRSLTEVDTELEDVRKDIRLLDNILTVTNDQPMQRPTNY